MSSWVLPVLLGVSSFVITMVCVTIYIVKDSKKEDKCKVDAIVDAMEEKIQVRNISPRLVRKEAMNCASCHVTVSTPTTPRECKVDGKVENKINSSYMVLNVNQLEGKIAKHEVVIPVLSCKSANPLFGNNNVAAVSSVCSNEPVVPAFKSSNPLFGKMLSPQNNTCVAKVKEGEHLQPIVATENPFFKKNEFPSQKEGIVARKLSFSKFLLDIKYVSANLASHS